MGSNKGEKYKEICKIAKDKFGVECLDDEYKYNNTKMTWIDSDGYKYYLSPAQIKNISEIERSVFNSYNKYTIENINNFLKINKIKTILLSKKYKSAKTKMKFKCKCGNVFERDWYTFYKGYKGDSHYCRGCVSNKISQSNTIDTDEIYNRILNKEGINVISKTLFNKEYKNTKSKISVIDDNLYKYKLPLIKILDRDSHSPFHKFNPYTYDNIDRYLIKNELKCKLVRDGRKYTGNMMKLKFKCDLCGNIYKRDLNNLTNDNNNSTGYCPECAAPIAAEGNCYYNTKNALLNKNEWIKEYAIVYIIKIDDKYSDNYFYKAGITNTTIKERFSKSKAFKNKYDISKIKTYRTNRYDAIFIEQDLLDYFYKYKYTPQYKFAGSTECFDKNIDINKVKMFIENHDNYKKEVSNG